ncbi:MAG: TIGR02449 family protein [Pseudomonadales bacterium]|nr:TIGR02449 family protein [Pseudomonadales bacterium]
MSNEQLSALEHQIDQLIYHCNKIEKENAVLRSRESDWEKERKELIKKNQVALTRVETMIEKLQKLDIKA